MAGLLSILTLSLLITFSAKRTGRLHASFPVYSNYHGTKDEHTLDVKIKAINTFFTEGTDVFAAEDDDGAMSHRRRLMLDGLPELGPYFMKSPFNNNKYENRASSDSTLQPSNLFNKGSPFQIHYTTSNYSNNTQYSHCLFALHLLYPISVSINKNTFLLNSTHFTTAIYWQPFLLIGKKRLILTNIHFLCDNKDVIISGLSILKKVPFPP